MPKATSLIIFARYPEHGKVKTRLAATTGAVFATAFYKLCAEHITREAAKVTDLSTVVFYSDANDALRMPQWLGQDFFYCPQREGDLGERILSAFQTAAPKSPQGMIIIGTDVPELNADVLRSAMKALKEHDVVIGPAPDGGYYLLGMKRVHPELFSGITWSTDTVFATTMQKAITAGLRVYVLPELLDVDTEEDLRLWLEKGRNRELQEQIRNSLPKK